MLHRSRMLQGDGRSVRPEVRYTSPEISDRTDLASVHPITGDCGTSDP
jgi:hypothetical protein